jgi:HEAT repeat protein
MGSMELLRTLYWSIPESPKAVATLQDWLSKPDPRRFLFGMKDADEIWPTVPQFGPLLAQWLRFADQVKNAAEGLGAMGTNTAFAVPDLIDVFQNGVAGHPPNTNMLIRYAPGIDPLIWNRGAAIQALGNIGVASTEVLETLTRAWTDPHPGIRALSADAVGKLGPKSLPVLSRLLARLDTTNRMVLEYQVETIGKMEPGAREAIPVLRHWADPASVAGLPAPERLGHVIRWFDDPLPLPGGAAVALLQIAPDEANGFGKIIAQGLTPGPDSPGGLRSADRMIPLRPLAAEIVPALEPALSDNRQWVRQLTAFQILCLAPDHPGARALLLDGMRQAAPPSLRAQAAIYYWRITGETNQVLGVIRETLATVKDNQSQPPLNYTSELGPAAKPLVPQIQALLTNEDWSIRQLAGKALRNIDPTALPPINEGYP